MIRKLSISLFLMTSIVAFGQHEGQGNAYRIVGSNIVLYLKKNWSRTDQEKLLEQSGMSGLSLDTLWKFGSLGRWAREGWKLSGSGRSYHIYKSVNSLSSDVKWGKDVFLPGEFYDKILLQTSATFGSNSFKKKSIVKLANGETRFFLQGFTGSKDVYLSGTFNEWSTLAKKMTLTDSGWVCTVPLNPGKHVYKFIVGGRWMADPLNPRRENDFYGGDNSVYFASNYQFKLAGHTNVKQAFVSGSFNDWSKSGLPMERTPDGWKVDVFLKDGSYDYKFVVGDEWILDPANPEGHDDSKGNRNSVLRIGKPYVFLLSGYTTSKKVILSGEFNGWNEGERQMIRSATGWKLPMVLAPGNYQYKFIVDGQWIIDRQNPHTGQLGGEINSVTVVKPNFTFSLPSNVSAHEVKVAGNFNNWTGYTLEKKGDLWTMDVYLPPGKCLYKFIIDGKWIIDPNNSLWEQNRYGTGNSVLWIPPQ